jgi:phage-related baseplate assembly protein
MTDFTLDDLAALPVPQIIQTLDYEAILAERMNELVALGNAAGFVYDTAGLESEPGRILVQEAASKEISLRARGNDIARARYLYYARGSEVDHLGAFYDTLRLTGEGDARYKVRIIESIRGRSTGGTAPRYRSVALASSLRVADAIVYTEGVSPQVNVAVFAADNNGVADAGLLAIVSSALNAPTVRMVNDRLNIRSAVVQTVPVTAQMWLLPNADLSIVTQIQSTLAASWASVGGLGRDLTRSWITARLMVEGVQRVNVTAPVADVIMQPFQAVRISSVVLTVAGRDF